MTALTDRVTLNSSERRLVKSAQQGTVADLRGHQDGHFPPVRAELLRELCAGGRQWAVQDRIHMIGGRIRGRLELAGASLTHPLYFRDCVFEDTIDLRQAQATSTLRWEAAERGPVIAAILADEFECDESLIVSGVTITGVVSLNSARVRGDLRLTNCHLAPPGDQAILGRDLRVNQTLFLDGPEFHAEGE